MTDLTINDAIDTQIDNKITQIPYPTRCKITKVYENQHVDIETDNGELTYVGCIGNNLAVGHTGILIFLDGSTDDYLVITR